MAVAAGGAPAAVHTVLATILGELTAVREGCAVTGLYFPRHWPRPDRAGFGPRSDEGFGEVTRQLGEFLDGDRTVFELPLKVMGSEFDRRVWELVSGVPYGETVTYGELARSLGGGRSRGTSARRWAATRCASSSPVTGWSVPTASSPATPADWAASVPCLRSSTPGP
jgi:methylated-DNA-[protein]-cysteine S-methyltransferase